MASVSIFVIVMIIFAANAFYFAQSARLNEDLMVLEKHEHWMAKYGKVYENQEEKEARLKIFKENLKYINEFNKASNSSYKMGLNHFADLTKEEFAAKYLGYKKPSSKHLDDYYPYNPYNPYNPYDPYSPPYDPYNPQPKPKPFKYENVNVADLPPSLDWRQKGAVTPIKDQSFCGYCWAFASVAAIEGINQIKTGHLVSLSEQQLADCMGVACSIGSQPTRAFEYVASNGGIATESEYPYNPGYQEACQSFPAAAKITGYESVPANDEVSLLKAVANQPVTVLIDGTTMAFYESGVVPNVPSNEINHAVVVVGYGTDERRGMKYWLVKNSWGENHGENGYFRVQRDGGLSDGTLGILTNPTYPII